jgi:ribosomal protein L29
MKGFAAKDLRSNDVQELRRTLAKLQDDLFQQRLKHATNQLTNTMLIRKTRRQIAILHTVLGEEKET